jgi:hypothetical protein
LDSRAPVATEAKARTETKLNETVLAAALVK